MNLPVEVIEAVKQGRCVVFLGSRASLEAAELGEQPYPDAKTLARELGWKKPKLIPGQKPKPIAPSVEQGSAAFEAEHGRGALIDALQGHIGAAAVAPSAAHHGVLRHFSLAFTTVHDDLLERAAAESGVRLDVVGRGEAIPDAEVGRRVLVKLWGGFEHPEQLLLTPGDYAARPLSVEIRKRIRQLIRANVILFVGYRPDEEEFERLFGELSEAYGGELPRCHLASAQGPIDDYLWQKWVWRGLLLFTADPVECLAELEVPR